MTGRRDREFTRPLQIGFLVLLGICTGQVAWWIIDQIQFSAEVQESVRETDRADLVAAHALIAAGQPPAAVLEVYPRLVLSADSGTLVIAPSAMARFERERQRRINRYLWEGGFFLLVLLGAMAVVFRALREAAELHRRHADFLTAVSHELKSPLTSLRLSLDTLMLRDPPGERRADLLGRALGDLARLDHMIGNILDASRLSGSPVADSRETIDLAAEIQRVMEETEQAASSTGTTVTADLAPALRVHANRESVHLVIRNLLDNAVKAAPAGAVSIRAERDGDRIRLQVRDDGIGFPPSLSRRLFEKFYRVASGEADMRGGTGLGLYLVRRCVELDHGTVQAASGGPRQGAEFTVTWPGVVAVS